jgi:UDP-GlcNAc:undecaprenyl-phosphate/decaprenyl-phosphate GlcNAc-1-phosphate transferase
MGDAGAYFLGYVLAATSILGNLKSTMISSIVPPLVTTMMFLLVPIVDTTQVVIRRLLAGKNPMSTPGKDHLHHRLLASGFSQPNSAAILWGFTLMANLIAMKVQGTKPTAIGVTAIGIITLLLLTVWQRVRGTIDPPNPEDADTNEQIPSSEIPSNSKEIGSQQ